MPRIVVIIGASGVGKTAVTRILGNAVPWQGHTHHFDTIGVPSCEDMQSLFGGADEWQRWATAKWIEDLSALDFATQVLEGQTRPSFINEAANRHPSLIVTTVLLDCTREVRERRLLARGHPDLATDRMEEWSVFLREQARTFTIPAIDTSELSPGQTAGAIVAIIGSDSHNGGAV